MTRQKPDNYGMWWQSHSKGADWYAQIYADRQPIHDTFIAWVKSVEATDRRPFSSVLEVGCGCAVVYPDVFAGKQYTGFDFSGKEINWCRANRSQAGRSFLRGDFIVEAERPLKKFELVFSHAVVDHVYDIDAFIDACVKQSSRWVYLTAYRGWFPSLREHVYAWDEWTTSCYNSLSPSKVLTQLHRLGCTEVQVKPQDTGKDQISQETIIVARVTPTVPAASP